MRVEQTVVVNAPREVIWDCVTDPATYTDFFAGMTRFDVESRRRRGCGARYRMLLRVGSAEVGGLIEVVEFEEPGDMAWTSVLGLDQRGRWRLRERYHAPGGLLGWMTDRLAAPIVRRHIHHTLQNLKRQIESRQAEKARRAPRKRTPARA